MAAKHRARRTSPLNLPSAFDLFVPSRDFVLNHFGVFGPLLILPFIFWGHSWVSVPAGSGHYWSRFVDANYGWPFPSAYFVGFIGFSILWFIFAVIAGTLVQVMLQDAQLDVVENKVPTFSKLWGVAKKRWLSMLGLYVVMGVIITVGFILFIVPGLFMLRRYIFAPYIMLDKKCGIKDALDQSHHLGFKNTGSVWGLIGVLFLIGLLGIVPIIGSLAAFIVGALYSVAPAIRYQQLKNLV